MIDMLREFFLGFGPIGLLLWTVVKVLAIVMPVILGIEFEDER